jgi:mycofactocin precursor peptide peptidase
VASTVELGGATWPDIAATQRTRLLAVPLGSLEQHGPHLPLDTDTQIARELAARLARSRPDVVVAPAIPYGASGEHAAFEGTLLVNHVVLADLLVELVRSARDAFAGVVVVSAHGGNHDALTRAEARCRADGDEVMVWPAVVPSGDAHAGRTETSLMLAIDPAAVRVERAEPGCTEPLDVLLPRLRTEGVRPVASNGVLGDPRGASGAEGEELLIAMAARLVAAVGSRWPEPGDRDGDGR